MADFGWRLIYLFHGLHERVQVVTKAINLAIQEPCGDMNPSDRGNELGIIAFRRTAIRISQRFRRPSNVSSVIL